MKNNPIDQAINGYLIELTQALSGQDPALIQDARFDAEEHLRAALEDSSTEHSNTEHSNTEHSNTEHSNTEHNNMMDNLEAAFADICDSYGSPQEIAEFYCDMEDKVNLALNGNKAHVNKAHINSQLKTAKVPARLNAFFAVLTDPKAYTSLIYMLAVMPMAVIYFAWVALFGSSSLGLSLLVVGLPLFLLFLKSMQTIALFEGRLIETLLGQRMPRRPQYQQHQQSWRPRLIHMLVNRRTWTTIVYLLLQLPLGMMYFICVTVVAVLSIGVFLSPIVDPILHAIDPIRYTIDINWYWAPLVMPGGVLGFVLTLHGAKILGKFQAKLARYLLLS